MNVAHSHDGVDLHHTDAVTVGVKLLDAVRRRHQQEIIAGDLQCVDTVFGAQRPVELVSPALRVEPVDGAGFLAWVIAQYEQLSRSRMADDRLELWQFRKYATD